MFADRTRQVGVTQDVAPDLNRPWVKGSGIDRNGDLPCDGGASARHVLGGPRVVARSGRRARGVGGNRQSAAIISAQRNPASSRAIAVTTTVRTCLRGQATVAGTQPPLRGPGPGQGLRRVTGLAARQPAPDLGAVAVGPGGFDELGAQVLVAGVGDVTAVLGPTGGVLAGDEPGEGHEAGRGREPPPVT